MYAQRYMLLKQCFDDRKNMKDEIKMDFDI